MNEPGIMYAVCIPGRRCHDEVDIYLRDDTGMPVLYHTEGGALAERARQDSMWQCLGQVVPVRVTVHWRESDDL